MKTCRKCKLVKSIDCFAKQASARDGLFGECRECTSARNKERRDNADENMRKQTYANNRKFAKTLKGRAFYLYHQAKQRAKKSGRFFNIDRDFIMGSLIIGRCWMTGFVFRYEDSKRGGITPFSPSLDRIKSEQGYIDGNVQVVCSMYNIGKAHHDELDFIAMCMAVAERNRTNQAAIDRLQELRCE